MFAMNKDHYVIALCIHLFIARLLRSSVAAVASRLNPPFSLSRCRFDVMVNGGGAITLQFQRSPFRPMTRTVFVPWNQVNYRCHCIIIEKFPFCTITAAAAAAVSLPPPSSSHAALVCVCVQQGIMAKCTISALCSSITPPLSSSSLYDDDDDDDVA
jgi:hypothetical protein